jgi:hypothetical protein
LRENPEKIYWPSLCRNASTKEEFDYLRENLERVDWSCINMNPNKRAIDLLMDFPERIQWHYLLLHSDIFETTAEYDYRGIRQSKYQLHEEFQAWAGHPSKMTTKWRDWGFEVDVEEDGSL